MQGAAKPNLQGGTTKVLPRDPRQGVPVGAQVTSARIFKPSMGTRNLVGIGLSYRPARLHMLAELTPCSTQSLKIRAKILAKEICLSLPWNKNKHISQVEPGGK